MSDQPNDTIIATPTEQDIASEVTEPPYFALDDVRAWVAYYQSLGLTVHPIPAGKAPGKWKHRRYTPADWKLRDKIGANWSQSALLKRSPTLRAADFDLDHELVIRLAPFFLPATLARWGRNNKPNSHWPYLTDLATTQRKARLSLKHPKTGKAMLELLSGGINEKGEEVVAQSVMPPGFNDSGDEIRFEPGCDISLAAEVPGDRLLDAYMRLGLTAILAICWPQSESGHDAFMRIGGWTARLGWSRAEMEQLIKALVAVLPKSSDEREAIRNARDGYDHQHETGQGYGLTGIRELFEAHPTAQELDILGLRNEDPRFPDQSKNGLRPTVPNGCVALEALGLDIRRNEFAICTELGGRPVSDDDYLLLAQEIHGRHGFYLEKGQMADAVRTASLQHRYHPVRDYLDGLRWDGKRRIDALLIDRGGVADTELNRQMLRCWFIGAVRRIRKPGTKADAGLTLIGAEGLNKSKFLRAIAVREQWFTDSVSFQMAERELLEQTQGKWIIEFSDLRGMTSANSDYIKAKLSRTADRARKAYDREHTEAPRQYSWSATANREEFLTDPDGNRRWWAMVITRMIDLDGLDVDQLWAEAAAAEAAGKAHELPEELWEAARLMQQGHLNNPLYEQLGALLTNLPEGVSVKVFNHDLWRALGIPVERRAYLGTRLNEAMVRLGFRKPNVNGRLRLNGVQLPAYVRGMGPAFEPINVIAPAFQGDAPTAELTPPPSRGGPATR